MKFEVGDVVVYKGGSKMSWNGLEVGSVATVLELSSKMSMKVTGNKKFPGGIWTMPKDWELARQPEKVEQKGFKVGDRVEVLEGNGWIKPCKATVKEVSYYLGGAVRNYKVKPDPSENDESEYTWYIKPEFIVASWTDLYKGTTATEACIARESIDLDKMMRQMDREFSDHIVGFSAGFLFNLGKPRRSFMENVKDLFKSHKQKMFEKYIFRGDSLDMNSPIVQKVLLQAFEKELLAECKRVEEEENRGC